MKYISVTSPGSSMSKPIFNYFDDYLVSLGEPATSDSWDLTGLRTHLIHMLHNKPSKYGLYIDSGGFQIIVGYVSPGHINKFIEAYHTLLLERKDHIDTIFALDVFSLNMFPVILGEKSIESNNNIPNIPNVFDMNNPVLEKLYEYNKYSMESSINLIKQYPEISNKQVFIMQSGNSLTFEIWKKLFTELEVYKHYKRWSIGGLVGLKKRTNAKFSHAVPATLWLLTYQKKYDFKIEQVHWLGQSSRLSFLSMALFERLYDINMTSDSSQLVRFAPIEAKLPYIVTYENDFKLIHTIEEVKSVMFKQHSIPDAAIYIRKINNVSWEEVRFEKINKYSSFICEFSTESYMNYEPKSHENVVFKLTPLEFYNLTGKIDNQTFIELQSQNLDADLKFGNFIVDKIMKLKRYFKTVEDKIIEIKEDEYIDNKDHFIDSGIDAIHIVEDIRNLHHIMDRGRTATELFNNLQYFKDFRNIVSTGNTLEADIIMEDITKSYIKD